MNTKLKTDQLPLTLLIVLIGILAGNIFSVPAAIITFENPPVTGGYLSYQLYSENDVLFRITASDAEFSLAWMRRHNPNADLYADSGSTHMEFKRDYAFPNDLVSFSQTNGTSFGIIAVDLAEPEPNWHVASTVIFAGLKTDGSMVTNTFTTDGFNDGKGGLADFQTFTFDSSFSSGLTSVQIVTPFWAMDNLVIVPEPGSTSLLVVGILGFAGWAKSKGRKCTKTTAT